MSDVQLPGFCPHLNPMNTECLPCRVASLQAEVEKLKGELAETKLRLRDEKAFNVRWKVLHDRLQHRVEVAEQAERDLAAARQDAERLTDLLRVEQDIATRVAPFLCNQIECCRFNERIRAGECACYEEKAREHRSRVRAAIDAARAKEQQPDALDGGA